MEKDPLDQSTSSTQKPLSVILDEIEVRADPYSVNAITLETMPSDVPALVKALRRAIQELQSFRPIDHALRIKAESEIVAILEKKEV